MYCIKQAYNPTKREVSLLQGKKLGIFVLLLFMVLLDNPLFATHEYIAETAADFTVSGSQNMIGALVGTLVLDPSEPIQSLSISGSSFSSSGIQFYYTQNGQLQTSTISGSLYVQYYNTGGGLEGSNLTSDNSLSFNNLDTSQPISFYLLVNSSQYSSFLRNFIFSPKQFVGVGVIPKFTIRSASNNLVAVSSNQGVTTLPNPFLGGGASGPAGINSLSIGNSGIGFWSFFYNIAEQPLYSISFTNDVVDISNLQDAIISPFPINTVVLSVENFNSTYMGESRVMIRFYQSGYLSFRFLLSDNPSIFLPFSLYSEGSEIPYNSPFSPWQAPMGASNSATIQLMVTQQDYERAVEGTYQATITVEIISGI
ncbi:MAG: hypothetical protein H0S77_04720 [Spirochaetaceae bacterium]|jgi:hypothetical protein|nr:hypothetical protein [Spirochaetaceae bacterium]MDN5334094.1 hypothetical protein [Sphaerochaeta sp.]